MTAERKSALILSAIAVSEGTWVAANILASGSRFVKYAGFQSPRIPPIGWLSAIVTAGVFIALSTRLPAVREHLFRASWLKILALAVAVTAGICEECIFRKLLMDTLHKHGTGVAVQIGVSAAVFGVAHGLWGLFRRSWRAAIGASAATGLLGLALAVTYVLSGRIVAPAITAHFLVNLFVEPGLSLAATRGEMGGGKLRPPSLRRN